jgi:hypothetical protein
LTPPTDEREDEVRVAARFQNLLLKALAKELNIPASLPSAQP